MNKIGLLFLPVFCFLAQPIASLAQQEDPSETFLKAYMTAQQADKLERENQLKPALVKLRFAGSLLEELKKASPDWQPAIVEYRGRKIADSILRLQSKIATQVDLAENAGEGIAAADASSAGAGPAEPSVDLARPPSAPNESATQAAVESATRVLRARVDALEAELKKSQTEMAAAQKEKSDLASKLQHTTADLEQARGEAARSTQAVSELRDQLATAQKSLSAVQASGSGDQQAVVALKGEISQLQKALAAAEAGRTAAEAENATAKSKLLEANNQVASVTQERDAMRRERDDAINQLKVAREAETRVQVLVAQNSDLQQKLADAEKAMREMSADRPKQAQELAAVKKELETLRDQFVTSQRQNQESEKTIADLRAQLDEASGQLASAQLNGASPAESAQLVKENQMLRAIVVRERQEEARREQAKKLMLAEFDKLKIKSEVLDQQIHLLAEPITRLSDEELALLKAPVVTISNANPGSVKASLTMAKSTPLAPMTISNPPAAAKAAPPAGANPGSLQASAEGSGNAIGPEVETTFQPGVPGELVALAREAKSDFDRGRFKEAEQEYQSILAKSPNNLYSLSNLGVVFFRNGKLKAAEQTLKKAIAIAPKDEFTHTTLGIVYYRQSKFDDALSELTKSLALNPKSATAHNYLGITASQKGWQEAAEKEMLEAIANNPEYADAHFNLAVIYSTAQPPAKELARRHYQKALALGAQPDPALDQLLR